MAEEAIDEQGFPAPFDPRQVVTEGRTHVGAHFGDLGFGEGGMDRIGRIGEFDQRARGHASAFVVFDHGRADHETLVVRRGTT